MQSESTSMERLTGADFTPSVPGLPPLRVQSCDYAASLRYQFILLSRESRHLGHTMICTCSNRQSPARIYSHPDYHATTCGYAALIRKRSHDHVVKLTIGILNQTGAYGATEPLEPERAHGGPIPDIYLVPTSTLRLYWCP